MPVSKDEEDTIYPWSDAEIDTSCEEIEEQLSALIGNCYDSQPAARSGIIKKEVAEILGYETDGRGSRSGIWKSVMPYTFAPHRLQVRTVGIMNNLQIWGSEAEIFSEDSNRIALILMDSNGCVRDVVVLNANEVSQWDGTGTITIKHQGTITQSAHQLLSENQVVNNTEYDLESILEPLIGEIIPDSEVRNQGEYVTEIVAECFGEKWEEDGEFPDLELRIEDDDLGSEVKSQRDDVIDFGSHSPNSDTITESGYSPREVVYIIVVIRDSTINGIICSRGADLEKAGVSVISSVHGKSQRRVPPRYFNREVERFSQPKCSFLKSICRFLRLCR